MVFDTEVYSNTGGQASKASQISPGGSVRAAGRHRQKNLAEIAMSYGYDVCGADRHGRGQEPDHQGHHTEPRAITAVPHHWLCPCEMHGVKGGMTNRWELR